MIKKQQDFVGRKFELAQLESITRLKTASIVVLQGRRRIGKSRLIQEFAKNQNFYQFSGLVPDKKTTAQSQRLEFAQQYKKNFKKSLTDTSDWSAVFTALAKATEKKKAVILLDEISWLGSLDPDFVGKLKIAWDLYFSNNRQLILVLCGSISWWIEEHILNNTGFFGRINLTINLPELSLQESYAFLKNRKQHLGTNEILKILSVVGCVPRYLELIDPLLSAEDNIKKLCFQKNATLLKEYDRIFTDIFGKRSVTFERIINILVTKRLSLEEIAQKLKVTKSSNLIGQLNMLKLSGFIEEDYTWDIKTGKISKFKYYRLKDNYLRFYLKYLAGNKVLIEAGNFQNQSLYKLTGIEAIFGLQFENLILNSREQIHTLLGIDKADLRYDGAYFQRTTKLTKGCQIDYLIQTKQRNVYICEIKFKRDPISNEVIKEVQKKFLALKKSFNTSYRLVLISAGEVKNSVRDTDFFDKIITFDDLLG